MASAWFKGLAVVLRTAIAGFEGQRFGFVGEEKRSRTLVALICGFAMGYRSGKEIADVIEADKLWRKVLRARVPQIDLSRLVCVLAEVGVDPLRVALLASASEGIAALHLDGDSSLLELHGKQEGGAWWSSFRCPRRKMVRRPCSPRPFRPETCQHGSGAQPQPVAPPQSPVHPPRLGRSPDSGLKKPTEGKPHNDQNRQLRPQPKACRMTAARSP